MHECLPESSRDLFERFVAEWRERLGRARPFNDIAVMSELAELLPATGVFAKHVIAAPSPMSAELAVGLASAPCAKRSTAVQERFPQVLIDERIELASRLAWNARREVEPSRQVRKRLAQALHWWITSFPGEGNEPGARLLGEALVDPIDLKATPREALPMTDTLEFDWHRAADFNWGRSLSRDFVRKEGAIPEVGVQLMQRWFQLFGTHALFAHVRDIVCVAAPPTALRRNGRGQLHAEGLPAVEHADGSNAWALGGVVVPKSLVLEPELDSLESIVDELNAEVRRLRIERWAGAGKPPAEGWKRYLAAVGAERVDERRNDAEGTREALFRTARGEALLVCHCPSTARVYALEIPADAATCEQAQRWLWSGSALAEEFGKPFNLIGRT